MNINIAISPSFQGRSSFAITQLSHFGSYVAVRLADEADAEALQVHGFRKEDNSSMYRTDANLAYNVYSS